MSRGRSTCTSERKLLRRMSRVVGWVDGRLAGGPLGRPHRPRRRRLAFAGDVKATMFWIENRLYVGAAWSFDRRAARPRQRPRLVRRRRARCWRRGALPRSTLSDRSARRTATGSYFPSAPEILVTVGIIVVRDPALSRLHQDVPGAARSRAAPARPTLERTGLRDPHHHRSDHPHRRPSAHRLRGRRRQGHQGLVVRPDVARHRADPARAATRATPGSSPSASAASAPPCTRSPRCARSRTRCKLEVPLNAQYIRNMIIAAHGVHDHIVHFYHLSALDWVDIVSALKGDPARRRQARRDAVRLQGATASPTIHAVRDKLKTFVGSGQLGVFASGYWGHPAMKLPPDINLLAATHYLQALDVQRSANKIVTILGSKTPHIQNLAVGGVANPINPNSQSTLTLERLYAIKTLIDELGDFVNNAMIPTSPPSAPSTRTGPSTAPASPTTCRCPTSRSTPRARSSRCPAATSRPATSPSSSRSTASATPIFRDGVRRASSTPGTSYTGERQGAAPVRRRDHAAIHRLPGRRQILLDQGADLPRQARAGRPARQRAGHVRGRPRADQEAPDQAARDRLARSPAPRSRSRRCTRPSAASRRARCAARCCSTTLQSQWQLLVDNIAKGDIGDLQPPGVPEGRGRAASASTRRRAACCRTGSSSRTARSRTTSAWCRRPGTPARATRTTRPGPYEASLRRQPGRRSGEAARGAAHRALVRSVHRLRGASRRRGQAAARAGQGDVRT